VLARLVLPLAVPVGARGDEDQGDDRREAGEGGHDVDDSDYVDGEDGAHAPPSRADNRRGVMRLLRRQSPWRVLAVALLIGAVGCGIAAAATWSDPAPIEGTYLNRSIGAPAYSGVVSTWEVGGGGRVWLGVAIGLAIAGLLVAAIATWESRRGATRPLPAPPAPAPDRGP
jgi:hypothetical protein